MEPDTQLFDFSPSPAVEGRMASPIVCYSNEMTGIGSSTNAALDSAIAGVDDEGVAQGARFADTIIVEAGAAGKVTPPGARPRRRPPSQSHLEIVPPVTEAKTEQGSCDNEYEEDCLGSVATQQHDDGSERDCGPRTRTSPRHQKFEQYPVDEWTGNVEGDVTLETSGMSPTMTLDETDEIYRELRELLRHSTTVRLPDEPFVRASGGEGRSGEEAQGGSDARAGAGGGGAAGGGERKEPEVDPGMDRDVHLCKKEATRMHLCQQLVIEQILPTPSCAHWLSQPSLCSGVQEQSVKVINDVVDKPESSWLSGLAQAAASTVVSSIIGKSSAGTIARASEGFGSSTLEAVMHSDPGYSGSDADVCVHANEDDLKSQAIYWNKYTEFWSHAISVVYSGLPPSDGSTPELAEFMKAMDICHELQLWEEFEGYLASDQFLHSIVVWRELAKSVEQADTIFDHALSRYGEASVSAPALVATADELKKLREIMADNNDNARTLAVAKLVEKLRGSAIDEEHHRDEGDFHCSTVTSLTNRVKKRQEIRNFFRRKATLRASERVAHFYQAARLLRLASRSLSKLVRPPELLM
jgi:hypothetical protein